MRNPNQKVTLLQVIAQESLGKHDLLIQLNSPLGRNNFSLTFSVMFYLTASTCVLLIKCEGSEVLSNGCSLRGHTMALLTTATYFCWLP